MLQFVIKRNAQHTEAELAQMAIQGGCRWIQLQNDYPSDEELRNVAIEIIPQCRETDTFLIIDNNVEMVNEMKVSGVHLSDKNIDPLKAREILGPHAIIGITADNAADIIKYKGKDIDYVTLGPCRACGKDDKEIGIDNYAAIIDEVRNAGVELPIVAFGGISLDDVEKLQQQGVNGISMSKAIAEAPDPMLYTMKVMEKLLNIPG